MKISVSASGKVILSDDTAGGVAVLDPGCTFYGIADASYEVIQVSRINSGCVLNAPQLLQTKSFFVPWCTFWPFALDEMRCQTA